MSALQRTMKTVAVARHGQSPWRKFDAGEGRRSDFAKGGDCQVRALCVALGIPYREAWQMLYTMQGERSACSFELVEELHVRNSLLNVVREISFPAEKGKERMTAVTFCKIHKRGRFILQMPHHVAAVKDGELLDMWDSSRKCVYRAWEIEPRVSAESNIGPQDGGFARETRECRSCGHKTVSTSTIDACLACGDDDGLRPRHFLTRDKPECTMPRCGRPFDPEHERVNLCLRHRGGQ